MLKTVTPAQYPSLYEVLFSIAQDGGAINRAETVKFVLPDTYDLAKMEHILSQLNPDDFELFIYGEEEEIEKLICLNSDLDIVDKMICEDWINKL